VISVTAVSHEMEQTYCPAKASFFRQRDDPRDVYDLLEGHLRPHDAWKGSLAEGCEMDLMVQVAADLTSSFYENERDPPGGGMRRSKQCKRVLYQRVEFG